MAPVSRRRFLARVVVAASAAVGLGSLGCGLPSGAATPAPGAMPTVPPIPNELVLYSPEDRSFVLRLAERFTIETGVEVSVPPHGRSGSVFWALQRDLEEGRVQADVVYGGGPFFFYWLDIRDLLERGGSTRTEHFEPGTLPAYWRLVDWIGFTMLGRGAGPALIPDIWQLPARGVPLVIPDPRQWDYGTMLILSLLSWYKVSVGKPEPGWDWLRRMNRRPLLLAANPGELASALAGDQRAIALVPSHMVPALQARVPDLVAQWPDQVPLLPSGAAQVRGAPHPRLAARFLEWLRSAGARDILLSDYRLPASCQEPSAGCAEAHLAVSRALPLNVSWAYENYNETRREWDNRVV